MKKRKESYSLKLKNKVVNGLMVLILRDFGMKCISIIGQIILVRLVAPQYFGQFAIILFVVSFFDLFTDLGLSQAVVWQKSALSQLQLSSIFYIRILLSILSILLLLLLLPIFPYIYHQLSPSLLFILFIASFHLIVKSIRSFLFSMFDRELNFSSISRIETVGLVIYFIVAIMLAIKNLFVWNFVFALLAKEIFELSATFYCQKWRPSPQFSYLSIKPLIKYGYFLQLGSIVSFIENSTIPIVGFRLNAVSIGLLDWSLSVSRISYSVYENYGRAAFAGLSKIQDDIGKISSSVNKSILYLNFFSFLFVTLVFSFSDEFIHIVLSEKWVLALPSLYWFTASLIFFSISISIAHALLAIGKSKYVTIFTAVNIIFEIMLAFLLLNFFGFVAIAIAAFVSNIFQMIGYCYLGKKFLLSIEIRVVFFQKLLVLAISLLLGAALNIIISSYFLPTLILKMLILVLMYGFMIRIFYPESVNEIMTLVKERNK